MLETETLVLEIIPYVMVRPSVVLLMVATSITLEVGGCMTEGRAVDELCSTLGINGASVGSGDTAAGVSACDEVDRV